MKTIRKNVFETNSSSCHSITFSNKGSGFERRRFGDLISITLKSNDFGWEEREYCDSQSKFEYWFACYEDCASLRVREKFAEVANKDIWSSYPTEKNPLPESVWDEAFEEVYANLVDVLTFMREHDVIFHIEYDDCIHELEDYLTDFNKLNTFNPHSTQFNFIVDMGYGIDHQSAPHENEEAYRLGWSSPEEVYDWVFGDGSVETDNDNH